MEWSVEYGVWSVEGSEVEWSGVQWSVHCRFSYAWTKKGKAMIRKTGVEAAFIPNLKSVSCKMIMADHLS